MFGFNILTYAVFLCLISSEEVSRNVSQYCGKNENIAKKLTCMQGNQNFLCALTVIS